MPKSETLSKLTPGDEVSDLHHRKAAYKHQGEFPCLILHSSGAELLCFSSIPGGVRCCCSLLLPVCVSPFHCSTPFTCTTRWWTWDRSTGFGMLVITRSAACALRSSLHSGARIWMLLLLLWSVDASSRSSWTRYITFCTGVPGRAELDWKAASQADGCVFMELCAIAVTYILVLQKAGRNTKMLCLPPSWTAFPVPHAAYVCSARSGRGTLYLTESQNSFFL